MRNAMHWLAHHWWALAGALVALFAVVVIAAFLGGVPMPDAVPAAQSSKILAVDGSLITTLHAEEDRTIVPLENISTNLQEAVIATEDRDFYDHPGVSLKGIVRAVWANVRGRGVTQGGSTITQQYVRNAYESVGRERTVFRKIREVVVAVKLERQFSKKKILDFYLNTVYFGRGAYGAEAAARTYFSKSAKDLTLSESAYLAGVIRAPERFQPDRSPESASSIRSEVLSDMQRAKVITSAEAEAAKKEEPQFNFSRASEAKEGAPIKAAYFVEFVRRKLTSEFELSEKQVFGGGLEIHTTLDMRMQEAAETAIASTLDREDDPEAALVAVDVNGQIRAMVGGRQVTSVQRARGFNFAWQGGRQPGSAFKPFTLAAWVDLGKSVKSVFSAPAKITIESKQCEDQNGKKWEVSNFGNQNLGSTDIIEATVKSANTVYAQMVDFVKPRAVDQIAERAADFGNLRRYCSLALGTEPVTPLTMAQAYATFAGRGEKPDILFVTKIVAPDGEVIAEKKPAKNRAMATNTADTVNHTLKQVIARGTGTGAKIDRPAAGKTGTTQNNVDAWFVGYTPQLSAAVWMGYAVDPETNTIKEMKDVRGREITGGSFPASIWKKFMQEAMKGMEPVDFEEAQLGGEVVQPSPSPCPPDATPPPGVFCVEPSPSPSPTPSPSPSPSPTKKPPQGNSPQPSPAPSPSPSPSPAPSPSP